MSFLRRLFGLESNSQDAIPVASSYAAERRSATLLKAATSLKEDKRYDEAVAILRQAFDEIAKEGGGHPISTYLRLPMMLQLAGRREEAWAEYSRLLSTDATGMGFDPEIGPMERSQIYDKMRLMLQREGRHRSAVSMAIFSQISWAIGLKRQRRNEELLEHVSAETVSEMITPLLKKARAMAAHDEVVALLTAELSKLDQVDFALLANRIDAIIPRERTP
jgi:tetratricopeptide (TPR) repeat protein